MRTLISAVATLALVHSVSFAAEQPPAEQILFVCEHGNVKSLMAASYFNQLAAQRGLPWRAVSRGICAGFDDSAKDIAAALLAEGVDVSEFRPTKVDATDAAEAVRIVMIGTDLPAGVAGDEQRIERWNDVPPASTSYDAARSSLKAHIAELLERCTCSRPAGNRIVAISPLGFILRQRKPTFVPLGDGPHDREAQPEAAAVSLACGRRRSNGSIARRRSSSGMPGPSSATAISMELALDPQRDTRTAAVLDCIVDQVAHRACERFRSARPLNAVLADERDIVPQLFELGALALQQRAQIDRTQRLASRLALQILERRGRDSLHSLDAGDQARAHVGVVDHFCLHPQRGQRSAHVVADRSQRARAPRHFTGHLALHRVERADRATQIDRPVLGNFVRLHAVSKAARCGGQLIERPADPANEEQRHRADEHERRADLEQPVELLPEMPFVRMNFGVEPAARTAAAR